MYEDRLKNETHPIQKKNGPGLAEPVERFGLNNLSFAGPVIMGVGGKKAFVYTATTSTSSLTRAALSNGSGGRTYLADMSFSLLPWCILYSQKIAGM